MNRGPTTGGCGTAWEPCQTAIQSRSRRLRKERHHEEQASKRARMVGSPRLAVTSRLIVEDEDHHPALVATGYRRNRKFRPDFALSPFIDFTVTVKVLQTHSLTHFKLVCVCEFKR